MVEEVAYTPQQLAEMYYCSDRTIQRKVKDLKLEERKLAERQKLSHSSGSKETIIIGKEGAKEIYMSLRDKPIGDLNKYDIMRAMINEMEKQDIRISKLEHNMDKAEITHTQKGILQQLVTKIHNHTERGYRSIWKQHNHHFGIHSYNWLPYRKFEKSVKFLNSMLPLDEQYIIKYGDNLIQKKLEFKE